MKMVTSPPPMNPLTYPVCSVADDVLNVELCMSTHLAIVVNLRLRFAQKAEYIGLVIPRSLCFGDRPTQQALVTAANDFVARRGSSKGEREKPALHEVSARIDGRWTSLLAKSGQGRQIAQIAVAD